MLITATESSVVALGMAHFSKTSLCVPINGMDTNQHGSFQGWEGES